MIVLIHHVFRLWTEGRLRHWLWASVSTRSSSDGAVYLGEIIWYLFSGHRQTLIHRG